MKKILFRVVRFISNFYTADEFYRVKIKNYTTLLWVFCIPLPNPRPPAPPLADPGSCVWQTGTPGAGSFNNINWNTSVIVEHQSFTR